MSELIMRDVFNIEMFGKILPDSFTCENESTPTLFRFDTTKNFNGYVRVRRGLLSVVVEFKKEDHYYLQIDNDLESSCGMNLYWCCEMTEDEIKEILRKYDLIEG